MDKELKKSLIILAIFAVAFLTIVPILINILVFTPEHEKEAFDLAYQKRCECDKVFLEQSFVGNIDKVEFSMDFRNCIDIYFSLKTKQSIKDWKLNDCEYARQYGEYGGIITISSGEVYKLYKSSISPYYKGAYIVKHADSNFFEIYKKSNNLLIAKFNFNENFLE
jgi:hypothetical protein